MSASLQTATTFAKSIRYDRESRDYRAELDGVLIGYYPSYYAAEMALDDAAYERLIAGDCATAQELDGGADVNWNSADPPAPEPPVILDEAPTPEPPESAHPRAVTRESIQIDARLSVCANCQGIHRTQACPEIKQALFAPEMPADRLWVDIALGCELCRMRWHNFRAFAALLLSIPAEHLVIYAASYQAFVRSHAPESDMTINQVLQSWTRDMRRGGDNGPAALRMAA